MPLIPWTTTPWCTQRLRCADCRDPLNVAFRKSLSRAYLLPPDAPEFACPNGLPWSSVPAPSAAEQERSQPGPIPVVPTWDDLRSALALANPAQLPEFDLSRKALDGCSTCVDRSRRARWQQRIASIPSTTIQEPPITPPTTNP